MDNGIFGLAMYGALKRDDVNYIETKKGKVTLAELVKFYEEHIDERKSEKETKLSEQPKVVAEKEAKKENAGKRKRRNNSKGKNNE